MTVAFEVRKSLDDLVHELAVSFVDHGGTPAGHVCRSTRRHRCEHTEIDSRASLLTRLWKLVPESGVVPPAVDEGSAGSRGSSSKRAPAGSPAPWAAAPAELRDEVLRGAYALQSRCRVALGLPAVPEEDVRRIRLGKQVIDASYPAVELGFRALSRLPGLVLELRRKDHPLGVRELPDGRLRAGLVEVEVLRWHARALELLGYEVPWERLPPIENPDVVADEHWFLAGPACASTGCGHASCTGVRVSASAGRARLGPVCSSCSHGSCQRVRRRRQRLLPWVCPVCGADSLRVHPVTGTVRCVRPTCSLRDEPTDWQLEELESGAIDPWSDFDDQ